MKILLLILAFNTFAGQTTGKIVNMITDDEGIKVITEDKNKTQVYYLKKNQDNFLELRKQLIEKKNKGQDVKIIFIKNKINYIEKVD